MILNVPNFQNGNTCCLRHFPKGKSRILVLPFSRKQFTFTPILIFEQNGKTVKIGAIV